MFLFGEKAVCHTTGNRQTELEKELEGNWDGQLEMEKQRTFHYPGHMELRLQDTICYHCDSSHHCYDYSDNCNYYD